MARRQQEFIIKLEVRYLPMPEVHIPAWRAGCSLLLKLLGNGSVVRIDGLEAYDDFKAKIRTGSMVDSDSS
jgi:hypothetical protein